MLPSKFSIVFCLLFFSNTVSAQHDFSAKTWHFIDTSIVKKRNLGNLALLLKELEQKAITGKQYFNYIRCLNYTIRVNDLKTEDTLYFKNSACLDTLLLQNQLPAEANYALHILVAKRVLFFLSKYKRFNQNRYERNDLLNNYASFTTRQMDSIAMGHFEKAKALSKQINNTAIDDALWLSADPLQFLFKPGLFDIAMAAQINSLGMRNQFRVPANSYMNEWLALPPGSFIAKIDSLTNNSSEAFGVLKWYSEWLAYKKDDLSAYYFIETLARKNFYNSIKTWYSEAENIYEHYLRTILNSPYNTARANAVYQLCLLLNNQGNKYFPGNEYGYNRYRNTGGNMQAYDTAFRFHPARALYLFEQHQQMLDSFLYLKNILQQMKEKIKSSDLQFSMEANNLPGKPLLGELKFKNAAQLFYRIVKVDADDEALRYKPKEEIRKLLTMTAFTESIISLPFNNDFNYHNTYIKLDSLPPGNYRLLFADKKLSDTAAMVSRVQFRVTGIAVINNNNRLYVLDRQTGMPLPGAKLTAGYYREIKKDSTRIKKYVSSDYVVNKNGYVIVQNTNYNMLTVSYGNDSIRESINIHEKELPEDVYTKDEYDDLVEFYEDQAKAYVYTDRSIYRPGQTVYYKAIFITKNRKTGEPMVMSKQNLDDKLFGSVYKKWLTGEDPWLTIHDPFGKQMDSLKITPNEFGAVSGSFKIPKAAATGNWNIEPGYIDMDWKYGSFKVEEYKRPSYEIIIDRPKKELRIKDEFSFKVRVRSFAGASLNNVNIRYSLKRDGFLPVFDSVKMKIMHKYVAVDMVTAEGYTDAEGILEIRTVDSLLHNYQLADSVKWNFDYTLEAEALDATGESYEERATFTVSSRPVRIKLSLPDKLNRAALPQLLLTTEDKNSGIVNKNTRIRFYRTTTGPERLYTDRKLIKADEWIYGKEMLQQWFPQVDFYVDEAKTTGKILVWDTTIKTGLQGKVILPAPLFIAGKYTAEAICEEDGKILGELNKQFDVFDIAADQLPEPGWSFGELAYNSLPAGDSLTWYYGSSGGKTFSVFHLAYYSGKRKKEQVDVYHEQKDEKGMHELKLKIPAGAVGQAKLVQLFILNNQVFKQEKRIFITGNKIDVEPEIIIEKYRKKLSPGSKETFSVSVKTQNANIAAELMTTMYDASLDKLEKHTWEMPRENNNNDISTGWPGDINTSAKSTGHIIYVNEPAFINPAHSPAQPLWWVNPLDYAYTEIMGDIKLSERARRNDGFEYDPFDNDVNYFLSGRVAGLNISNTPGLENVVVVGYGTVSRRELMGSLSHIMIRGQSSLTANVQPLLILVGVIYEGDISKIDPNAITNALVLKGADASAIYGSRAAQGVLILSTKGDIVLPKEPEPVLTPRKNFNESAFFFPAVHAGKDGFYSFSFTMPETVTEWNWKMLAHTKPAKFMYAERKLNTQLPLMVQPNMPRLLYQGDKIILQSRITNLDSLPATGKITCKIEDAVTGNDITTQLVFVNSHQFSLNKKENKAAAFEIKVPVDQLHPLKIIIKASSTGFADAEEHIIPVLSPRVFVREVQPYYFVNGPDTVINIPAIPAGAVAYGMALAVNAKPQAALVNALPWLARYPYGCAEQTFNKLLANATALKLMQSDKMAQRSFNAARAFVNDDKTVSQKLPDELNEETMPWLNKANRSSLLKTQLFNLLDTSRTKTGIDELLQRIFKFQNADGGLGWFNEGESSFYISGYLLKGFGSMEKDSIDFLANSLSPRYDKFIQALIIYADDAFTRLSGPGTNNSHHLLQYMYARSYWQKQKPVKDSVLRTIQTRLQNDWADADKRSLYDQALLIMASLRFANGNNNLVAKALARLNSIRQLAISDEQHGIRWKELADADDLAVSAEETIGLLAEAFKASGSDEHIRNGIIKWLLTAKNEDHWSSTKGTAAAINLLFQSKRSALGETQTISTAVDDKKLTVTDDLVAGTAYDFSTLTSIPGIVKLKKENSVAASGSLISYYFSGDSSLGKLNKDIQLDKKIYTWNEASRTWDPVNTNTVLKIADRIRVKLTLVSSKALPFVFIDDKRAAAFEPADNSSRYEYVPGLRYYRSVKDAGYHFFAENIPSGRHEIMYELKVAQEGVFTSGPAVLQCMYKPEVSAYSNSLKIVTAH